MIQPPSTAPSALSKPPRVAAAKAYTSTPPIRLTSRNSRGATRMPAVAPTVAASPQPSISMRPTRMPAGRHPRRPHADARLGAGRHGRRHRRHPGGAAAVPGRQPDGRGAGLRLCRRHPGRVRQRARRRARRLDHRRERELRRHVRGRHRLGPEDPRAAGRDPGGPAGTADRAVRRQGGRAGMSAAGQRWPRLAALAVVAAAAVAVPFSFPPFRVSQFTLALAYAVAALGLNLLVGYAGQISLGHGAFFALGAYSAAIVMAKTSLPDLVTIPLAGALAFVAGLLLGVPALRLRGQYLALVTLGR